jgi:hypothetical protein
VRLRRRRSSACAPSLTGRLAPEFAMTRSISFDSSISQTIESTFAAMAWRQKLRRFPKVLERWLSIREEWQIGVSLE